MNSGLPAREDTDCAILSVSRLWVRLGGEVVLADVSFDLGARRLLGVVGPNGAGKSTLLRAILGLVTPDRGEIRVRPSSGSEAGRRQRARLGYVAQRQSVDPVLPVTALDVAMMGCTGGRRFWRRPGREDRQEALEALHGLGLDPPVVHRPVGALSGGQQQLVLVAAALVSGADLLLLDEPAAGLDPAAQNRFYRVLSSLRDEAGISAVIVSHDLRLVAAHADRLMCLNRRVYTYGKPEEVAGSERLAAAYGLPWCPKCGETTSGATGW